MWQLDRAAQKNALQESLISQRALPVVPAADLARDAATAASQKNRSVRLQGQWRSEHTVYLENRQMNGQPGFYAVTPLLLDDGTLVLVQRGWLPRDLLDRTRISAPPAPAGRVVVQGHMAPALARLYEFAGAASGPIRQNLEIAAFARDTGLPLRPLVVVQEEGDPPPQDGLRRQWPQPAADVQKHYGYAFQWFAMSALIIGLYAWFQLIRPQRPGPAEQQP
jgi:surfeit locus 1 family protein